MKTLPHSGKVGAVIEILGTDLTGATSVSFNGTASAFTINATGSAISATVPADATTGKIQVTTPGGNALQRRPFRRASVTLEGTSALGVRAGTLGGDGRR